MTFIILQNCFHEFLYTTTNEEPSIEVSDRKSQTSIRKILETTGTSTDKAEKAAIKIQAIFYNTIYIYSYCRKKNKNKLNNNDKKFSI